MGRKKLQFLVATFFFLPAASRFISGLPSQVWLVNWRFDALFLPDHLRGVDGTPDHLTTPHLVRLLRQVFEHAVAHIRCSCFPSVDWHVRICLFTGS